MALKYVLLGLIDIHPMSGYDIVKAFDYAALFYWHATHTQVYRTLKQLEKDGWIAGEVVHQTDNPSKRVFSITEAGREAMESWVREEPELPGFKHAFLIKFTYSAGLSREELLMQLNQYEEKLRARLVWLNSEEKRGFLNMARSDRERLLWQLIGENGDMYYQNEIRWVQKAKAAIAESEES
jgi:PadR family transcriptional regulator AphA